MKPQQDTVEGCASSTLLPRCFVQIEPPLFEQLKTLCEKEGIDLSRFSSEMLKVMIILHKGEMAKIVRELRCCLK